MSTMKDVAEKAGVSIATVSNSLSGAKYVSPLIKEKIQQAITDLNYTPNRISKKGQHPISKTIAFIVTQLDCIFFPMVISGIQKVANENWYDITFYPTNYNESLEKKYVHSIQNNNIAGIIIDTVISPSDTAYFQALSSLVVNGNPIPVVGIQEDLTSFGISSVTLNSYHGGYTATEHLIQKGCKKIVCITGPLVTGWASERLKGFQDCLKKYNLPYNSSFYCESDCSLIGGYQATQYLLANAIEFDGVFVQNDLMAAGAIKALKERSFAIPQDVKIVGYDNIFMTSLLNPSITSVHIPKQRLGEEAATLLLKLIQSPGTKVQNIELPLTLIERQTTNETLKENWDLFSL